MGKGKSVEQKVNREVVQVLDYLLAFASTGATTKRALIKAIKDEKAAYEAENVDEDGE